MIWGFEFICTKYNFIFIQDLYAQSRTLGLIINVFHIHIKIFFPDFMSVAVLRLLMYPTYRSHIVTAIAEHFTAT